MMASRTLTLEYIPNDHGGQRSSCYILHSNPIDGQCRRWQKRDARVCRYLVVFELRDIRGSLDEYGQVRMKIDVRHVQRA